MGRCSSACTGRETAEILGLHQHALGLVSYYSSLQGLARELQSLRWRNWCGPAESIANRKFAVTFLAKSPAVQGINLIRRGAPTAVGKSSAVYF